MQPEDLVITIEQYIGGRKLAIRQSISEALIAQEKDTFGLVNAVFNEAYRKFKFEAEIEQDNLRYKPKPLQIWDIEGEGYDPRFLPTRGGI